MLGFVPQPNLRACVPANSSGHWLLASGVGCNAKASGGQATRGRAIPSTAVLRGALRVDGEDGLSQA
jgi:hypothetical protein